MPDVSSDLRDLQKIVVKRGICISIFLPNISISTTDLQHPKDKTAKSDTCSLYYPYGKNNLICSCFNEWTNQALYETSSIDHHYCNRYYRYWWTTSSDIFLKSPAVANTMSGLCVTESENKLNPVTDSLSSLVLTFHLKTLSWFMTNICLNIWTFSTKRG